MSALDLQLLLLCKISQNTDLQFRFDQRLYDLIIGPVSYTHLIQYTRNAPAFSYPDTLPGAPLPSDMDDRLCHGFPYADREIRRTLPRQAFRFPLLPSGNSLSCSGEK